MGKGSLLIYRPKSFFQFVLIGFTLVMLPMVVAVINGGYHVENLFVQSEIAVYRAAQASQMSRALVAQITDMERNARQYQVLKDKALLITYANRHAQFLETATQLGDVAESRFLKKQLTVLAEKEVRLFEFFAQDGKNASPIAEPEKEFAALNQLAQSIVQEAQLWINNQVELLSGMANSTKDFLVWQTVLIGAGTLVFAVFLSAMIARPISQIDQAIRHIGDGELYEEVVVTGGTKDLQYLGTRINWLRHRLRELEEKKGNFMRHVSHELKTPLTAIREGSSLLAEGVLGGLTKSQKDVTNVIQRNSVSLQRMIENLLNFNALEGKRASLNLRPMRLDEVVEDVAADHKLALLSKSIRLVLDAPPTEIRGDREKLRVVVDNLLSNAIKYSPEFGTLNVAIHSYNDRVTLEVQDSGPGINPDDAQKVFEAFYRGRLTPNGDIRGSGLGLSIAKEFVQMHEGDIDVITETSKGAHFRVELPRTLEKAVA